VTPVDEVEVVTGGESPSPAPTPSPSPEEQGGEEETGPEEQDQDQVPEDIEDSLESQREPLNNIFDDLLGYDHRSDFGAEFNPFGETQKAFEELIQREVMEGEKLRQGMSDFILTKVNYGQFLNQACFVGLPPPGFQKVQDPWSSLDPAIIFSAPSPAPTTFGVYNMGNGFHQEQQQSYG